MSSRPNAAISSAVAYRFAGGVVLRRGGVTERVGDTGCRRGRPSLWCSTARPRLPAAKLHVARTVAHRAERSTRSALDEHGDSVDPLTVKYLNRLSELLFILFRVASTDSHGGTGDILWMPGGEHGRARLPEGDGAAGRPRQNRENEW